MLNYIYSLSLSHALFLYNILFIYFSNFTWYYDYVLSFFNIVLEPQL